MKYFDHTFGMWEEYSVIKGYQHLYSELLALAEYGLTKEEQLYIQLYTTNYKSLLGRIYEK